MRNARPFFFASNWENALNDLIEVSKDTQDVAAEEVKIEEIAAREEQLICICETAFN